MKMIVLQNSTHPKLIVVLLILWWWNKGLPNKFATYIQVTAAGASAVAAATFPVCLLKTRKLLRNILYGVYETVNLRCFHKCLYHICKRACVSVCLFVVVRDQLRWICEDVVTC